MFGFIYTPPLVRYTYLNTSIEVLTALISGATLVKVPLLLLGQLAYGYRSSI